MVIFLWFLEIFLALLWCWSLYAILKPEAVVEWTIERYAEKLKFYGCEAVITSSSKSVKVIRIGHALVLILLTIYMLLTYLLIKI